MRVQKYFNEIKKKCVCINMLQNFINTNTIISDHKVDLVHISLGQVMGQLRSSECSHICDTVVFHLRAGSWLLIFLFAS